jgi:hypothetical protein
MNAERRTIQIRGFSGTSLFKLVYLTSVGVCVPFFLFYGVHAFLGDEQAIVFFNVPQIGFKGFAISIGMGFVASLIGAAFAWLGTYASIRLMLCFGPLQLTYLPYKDTEKQPTKRTAED